jgi:hypothetical protein
LLYHKNPTFFSQTSQIIQGQKRFSTIKPESNKSLQKPREGNALLPFYYYYYYYYYYYLKSAIHK